MLLTLHTHTYTGSCAQQSSAQRHRSNLHIIKKLVVLLSSPFCLAPPALSPPPLHAAFCIPNSLVFKVDSMPAPTKTCTKNTHKAKQKQRKKKKQLAEDTQHVIRKKHCLLFGAVLCLCKYLDIRQLNLQTQMHYESPTQTHSHAYAHRHNLT